MSMPEMKEPFDPMVMEGVFSEIRFIAGDRASTITLDTNVMDLSLDSMERLEMVAALENRFGGRFPEHVLLEIETAREMILAVQQYLGPDLPIGEVVPVD